MAPACKTRLHPSILKNARELRKGQTDAETLLWYLLRRKNFYEFKFRRQYSIDHYVLDFYCSEARLGIELDGGQHNEDAKQRRDEESAKLLESKGISVIRFWNHEVLEETEGVLEKLHTALTQRDRGSVPSPCEGEG